MSGYIRRGMRLMDPATGSEAGYVDLNGNEVLTSGAAVPAPAALNASNVSLYNGPTVNLASGATMTVSDSAWAGLTAGLIIVVGQSGSATLAFSGTAVKENGSGTSASSVTLSACGVYALMQGGSSPNFRLTGSASL